MKNKPKNLADLMLVMFYCFIGVSTVQAGMSNEECKQSMEANDNKYNLSKNTLTEQDMIGFLRVRHELMSWVQFSRGASHQNYAAI